MAKHETYDVSFVGGHGHFEYMYCLQSTLKVISIHFLSVYKLNNILRVERKTVVTQTYF